MATKFSAFSDANLDYADRPVLLTGVQVDPLDEAQNVNVKLSLSEINTPTLILELNSKSSGGHMPVGEDFFTNWATTVLMPSTDATFEDDEGGGRIVFVKEGIYMLSLVTRLSSQDTYGPAPWPDGFVTFGTKLELGAYAQAVPAARDASTHPKYGSGGGYVSSYGYVQDESFVDQYMINVLSSGTREVRVGAFNLWQYSDPAAYKFKTDIALSLKRVGKNVPLSPGV